MNTSTVQIESEDLEGRANRALGRLGMGTPEAWKDSEATADLLALVALNVVLSCELGAFVQRETREGKSVIAGAFDLGAPGERGDATRALWTPFAALAKANGYQRAPESDAVEVGALPLGILVAGSIVAVAGVVARGAVVAYCANQASQLVNNVLQRRSDAQQLQASQKAAVDAVAAHVAREKEAGKLLPIDEATKNLLAALKSQSEILAAKTTKVDPGISVGGNVEWYKSPAVWLGGGVVAGLAAALWLSKKGG